ncbi:MAG TPA: hypothetical protein PK950_00760 [Candidatus Paceibacterota bacterium]|nr:hypothetical protein [Candidatus Paceibacterota bacterium]
MKKNIVITIILVLVVGFVAGYALKGKMKSANQGAAVSLSVNKDASALEKAFEAASNALVKVNAGNIYSFDPSKIVSDVDIKKVTEDTKRFAMHFPDATVDGTTISPMLEPVNCGTLPGGTTVYCCDTNSNTLTITNPHTGFTMTSSNGCVNGEWDRF